MFFREHVIYDYKHLYKWFIKNTCLDRSGMLFRLLLIFIVFCYDYYFQYIYFELKTYLFIMI